MAIVMFFLTTFRRSGDHLIYIFFEQRARQTDTDGHLDPETTKKHLDWKPQLNL